VCIPKTVESSTEVMRLANSTPRCPCGQRRRVYPDTDASVSLLALLPGTSSHQSTSTFMTRQLYRNPLTTFLWGGGTYYPGKDKKKRQLKRITPWYRLFCSSWWRKALSFSVAAVFVFSFVMRPFSGFMLEYGRLVFPRRRRGLHGSWLLYDESSRYLDISKL
jgi:hypothetical protein